VALLRRLVRRQELIEFGGIERTREQSHQQRPGWLLGTPLQDIRYAVRSFRCCRLSTVAVVDTLAVGIGANAAIFTLPNGTLLRQLPYRSPGNLISCYLFHERQGIPLLRNLADIEQLQQQNHTLDGGDQEISQTNISSDPFDLLGTAPALGRGFTQPSTH
jgi:hypothetical protein